MKEIRVRCNANEIVDIDASAKTDRIIFVLVDEKHHPIARYEFNSAELLGIANLTLKSTNVRIHLFDREREIIPTMKSELTNERCG